ncbi:MAG: crotonase/enoyl-CoA hydratase family protein [Rubrivivax sp.]|nr:crotonase/enoyl-CoA hydratase family protein [Rubrivivax sp.]HOW49066.1 crotonase/enoyl-CoA hydratase family protein [Rubrivivax sp.]
MNDRIEINMDGGVADVRLVRADKMNALDDAMFAALREAGEALKTRAGLRAVVLSGEGRAFCAGLDTANFGKMASGERGGARLLAGERTPGGANPPQHSVMVWREIPVPVIAAVHGVAYGGGFQLMLGAELRFVAPDTKLSIMEINWGLVPDMGGIALLRGLLRDDLARELVYTGRVFSGSDAGQLGLATRVCADPRAEALALAHEIAARSPKAMRAAKRLLDLAADADAKTILLAESREQAALIGSTEQAEAVRARLAGRRGDFAD